MKRTDECDGEHYTDTADDDDDDDGDDDVDKVKS